MNTSTVTAKNEQEAKQVCLQNAGFFPDAVREVDSGNDDERAWMCFESETDAELWDKQL